MERCEGVGITPVHSGPAFGWVCTRGSNQESVAVGHLVSGIGLLASRSGPGREGKGEGGGTDTGRDGAGKSTALWRRGDFQPGFTTAARRASTGVADEGSLPPASYPPDRGDPLSAPVRDDGGPTGARAGHCWEASCANRSEKGGGRGTKLARATQRPAG